MPETARPEPDQGARNTMQFSHAGDRDSATFSHHLLSANRKTELEAEMGLEPRHFDTRSRYPK